MVERTQLRVSDGERQAAVDRLRLAHDEGRLDLDEYDRRLAAAYSAVTYGDLDELFLDLPAGGLQHPAPWRLPAGATSPALRPGSGLALDAGTVDGMHLALKVLWTLWSAAVAINLTVWLLVGVTTGDLQHFWPMWMAIPGVVLLGATVGVQRMRRQDRRPH